MKPFKKDCRNCKYGDTCATNYCDAALERAYNIRDGKDCWQPKEAATIEETICLYWEVFFHGAAAFMKYMQNYYNYIDGTVPIYPSEMEDILKEFCKQFGDLKEIDKR